MIAALISATLGAATVVWLASTRMLDPRQIGWVMHGDWQIHFLGWQFFRHEPWQFPPGATKSFLEPIGTSLGYTDSIPLVAFALKPVAHWLPDPLQYLGVWFFVCFTLQAFFGALVISTWTERRSLQVVGAMFFVLSPTLASRIAHPALCAHWLLLWALWLNWRSARGPGTLQHGALGLTSGLVHPYLAVMVLALLLALAGRRLTERPRTEWARAALPFGIAVVAVAAGWWASGLFTLGSTDNLTALAGRFSMNLLAVVNPGTRSYFLPGFEVVSLDQFGEGFQYFGAGVLLLCVAAIALAVVKRPFTRASIPLVVVLIACATYAVLPTVSFGRDVLVALPADVGPFDVFRSTGRFFWPVGYTILGATVGLVARELRPNVAAAVLSAALAVQMIDLHQWWLGMHEGSRTQEFYAWDMPLQSPEWAALLPRYQHMRLYYPEFCRGSVAAPTPAAAYLASVYALTINDGFAARVDVAQQKAACQSFGDDFARGFLDDSTVYLLTPRLASEFESRLGAAVQCRTIDRVGVCVSSRSLAAPRADGPTRGPRG